MMCFNQPVILVFTRSSGLDQDTKYVGSKKSDKYHELTCRYVKSINPENLVQFTSKEDAESKGCVPCKGCKP
jgi:methylphosphotriester-DNA--protein-cysteine methyltransferase